MDTMRLPMMMVMNIAVTVTLARVTMTQTVILMRVKFAKMTKLNQLAVTGVKSTSQDKKVEHMNKYVLSFMLFMFNYV